ncbi:MAG: hypothetical protein AAFP86_16110 [Planctomycetota bacterium]
MPPRTQSQVLVRAARTAVVAAVLFVGAGCGGACEEGTTRAFRRTSASDVVTIEGTEACIDGAWLKHGTFVFRDAQSGDVVAEGAYDRGLEFGAWTQSLEGGVTGAGEFRRGERHGPWTYTYSNGRIQERGAYAEGERTGRWLSHRFDGTLWRDALYAEGALDGEVRVYTTEGTLDREASGVFAGGERVGPLGR